ncbi:MAG: 6-phosphogluconolactonase [Candidatus Limnocylindrales bacterium]
MRILAEPDDVAEAAAHEFMAIASSAIAERAVAHVALTGGSTVPRLYRHLIGAAHHVALDWAHVELWWGDERIVAPGDLAAHAHSARETLLRPGSPASAAHVHAFPLDVAVRDGPGQAAKRYATEIRKRIPYARDGLPVFDLVLLGMGADGHILSVFPHSPALAPGAPLVLAIPAPTHIEPHVPRLTLNPRVVGVARHVLVMCTGAGKAARVADVLEGPEDVRRLPAQLARGDNALWLLDAAAAVSLGAAD